MSKHGTHFNVSHIIRAIIKAPSKILRNRLSGGLSRNERYRCTLQLLCQLIPGGCQDLASEGRFGKLKVKD